MSRATGIGFLLCGAGFAASATRAAGVTELANPSRLVNTGPYAISRNPMYVGWTLTYLGCALLGGTLWPWILLPGVAAAIHSEVIDEERRLVSRFDDEYRTYAHQVRRYL